MKYLKIVFSAFLLLLFFILWYHLNRNYFPKLEAMGMNGITYLISEKAGYNNIMSHGSIYTFLFLVYLFQFVPRMNVSILIRRARKGYLLQIYKKVFQAAVLYSIIFSGVMTIGILLCLKYEFIIASRFFIGIMLFLLVQILYYTFIGSVFVLFQTVLSAGSKAMVPASVVSVFFVCLTAQKGIWTPVANLIIFDKLFENTLHVQNVLINAIKVAFLVFVLFFISLTIFKEKDIVNEKS